MARNYAAGAPLPGVLPAAFSRPKWLPVAVLAVCAALTILAVSAGPYAHDRGQRLAIAWVLCVPIAALRRWPLPVLAVATTADALVITGGNAPLPFGIMLGLASYLAAARLPRRLSIPAAAASAAALGGVLVYAALAVSDAAVAQGAVEGFLPLAAGWFIGDSVIHLDVTDDGDPSGLPASAAEIHAGPRLGIVGMRERITAFGGWLHAEPIAEGRGFRVTAQVPIEGAV